MGDILPILMIIFAFQYLVIRRPVPNLHQVLIGFIFVLFGLTLFLVGLEKALFPLGELMANSLSIPSSSPGANRLQHPAIGVTTSGFWRLAPALACPLPTNYPSAGR
jgi:hypothetical protein